MMNVIVDVEIIDVGDVCSELLCSLFIFIFILVGLVLLYYLEDGLCGYWFLNYPFIDFGYHGFFLFYMVYAVSVFQVLLSVVLQF